MSNQGWYPDPGGAPGRFRYWDGTRWSTETVSRPPSGPRRGRVLLFAVIAAVVIAVVAVIAVRLVSGDSNVREDPDPPSSTVSGWDDSSPLPSDGPSSPGDSTPVRCPDGDPAERRDHPDDGRAHGGRISFAKPGGTWQDGDAFGQRVITWGYDVGGVEEYLTSRWLLQMLAGEVRAEDGFADPQRAAQAITQCFMTGPYYVDDITPVQVHSKAITLDGVEGWSIRTEVDIDNHPIADRDDLIDVIVLDTGPDGSFSFFVGDVPPRDEERIALLDRTIESITVD